MSEQKEVEETKEVKIKNLLNKIDRFEKDLVDPESSLTRIYSSIGPKKGLFIDWADSLEELHELGWYKEPIGSISTHIKKRLKKLGYDRIQNYVHEVLPNKYKDAYYIHKDDEARMENPSDNSSKDINCEQENAKSIEIYKKIRDVFSAKLSQLKSQHYESKLDKKELQHDYLILNNAINFFNEAHDNRQSVPTITQHTLAITIATATMNYATGLFLTKLKKYGASKSKKNLKLLDELTTKQAGKICRGQVKNVLALFNPRNRDQAIDCGFYGLQCPSCGSYRLEEKAHPDSGKWLLFCYNCNNWSEGKTITKCRFCYYPFYEDALKQIEEEEKCPNCQKPVFMPKSRIIKLRS